MKISQLGGSDSGIFDRFFWLNRLRLSQQEIRHIL